MPERESTVNRLPNEPSAETRAAFEACMDIRFKYPENEGYEWREVQELLAHLADLPEWRLRELLRQAKAGRLA